MTFILMFFLLFLGAIVASLTIIPILIMVVFGIPTTKKLEGEKLLIKDNGIVRNEIISIGLLSFIFIGLILLINWLYPDGLTAYLLAVGVVSVFGFGQTGRNGNNVSDYMETNKTKFAVEPSEVLQSIMA